ncbi:TPA: CbbQ/NirQ/NorQ/GpvN family protein, partial [Citrobacter freundii]|nr:CbbQ/NirQ/NorQ/GpvN family protein [Citrobacter freundii]
MPSIPEKVTAIGYADGSNPFIPATDTNYVFRKEFLREVLAYLKEPGGDALFVTGPTGSGKTSGITEIAGRLNWPVQQITADGRMELTDLIGHHALVAEKPGQPPVMKFMYGPLAVAMREGHLLLINEVDLADPAELAGLNDVLEGRPL